MLILIIKSLSMACQFRVSRFVIRIKYNVHTNPNSYSLTNRLLNGACLLLNTELYDSHLTSASRDFV